MPPPEKRRTGKRRPPHGYRKRNKASKSARRSYKERQERKMQLLLEARALEHSELQAVSDDFQANNLLEKFPKSEPFPAKITVPIEFNDPDPVNPKELLPRVKPAANVHRIAKTRKFDRSAFCELCLRKWPPEQAVTFSSTPSWDSLDPSEDQRKVLNCLGIQIALDGRSICTSCYKMVDMLEDFRASCLKARKWMDRNGYGLEEDDGGDGWISEETVESLDITHMMVRNHFDRIINGAKEKAESNQLMEDEVGDLELAFEVEEVKLELDDSQLNDEDVEPVTEEAAADETPEDKTELSEDPADSVIKEPIEIKVFTCPKCSMKFDRRHSYTIHVNRCKDQELSSKLFNCPICGVNFKENLKLKFHMNLHRGIKPYNCRVKCNASFYSYHVRRGHELRCGADPLVCITCGVLKKTPKELETHMAVHGEATIPCEKCGKMFRTMRAQRKHQSAHSDERRFDCDVCGKGFKSSNALYVHRRIHTQEKPYSCQICGQGFMYKCSVKPHVMKCHALEEDEEGGDGGEVN